MRESSFPDGEGAETREQSSLTTIVSRVGLVEYLYAGEQLKEVKEYLANKLSKWNARLRQKREKTFEFPPPTEESKDDPVRQIGDQSTPKSQDKTKS
jgi:hypothetical protein